LFPGEQGFIHLKLFKEREGHCRVPQPYQENGFRLGSWVSVQRGNKGTLSADRRERLDKLGFVWNPLEVGWEEGYAYLKRFVDRVGHCRVPSDHKGT
jgi:hypothetical protein